MQIGIKKAMKKCLCYSFVMGCFACLALFMSSSFVASFFLHDKVSAMPLRILAFSLPFLALSSCMNGYFSALRKVTKTVCSQVLEEFFKISLITFLLHSFLPSGLEYACIALVLGSTISEFLSFLCLAFLFVRDKKKLTCGCYQDTNYTKQILKIALPISFTSYIRSGLSTLKQMMIPMQLEKFGLSCESALSQYGMINGMVMPLILFPCSFISSFSSLLIPEFSFMNAKGEEKKMNFALEKIFKFCFLFSFLVMGFFFCFAEELNEFIYPSIDISFYLKLLCPLIILMYIDNIVDSILKGLDKQVSVMGINIIDLTSSIFLIYFLLPLQGLKGYIIVLFASEMINGLLSLFLLVKETKLKIDFVNWIIKPFISIFILSHLFCYATNVTTLIEWIIHTVFFIVFYFILLIFLRSLVKKDFRV